MSKQYVRIPLSECLYAPDIIAYCTYSSTRIRLSLTTHANDQVQSGSDTGYRCGVVQEGSELCEEKRGNASCHATRHTIILIWRKIEILRKPVNNLGSRQTAHWQMEE